MSHTEQIFEMIATFRKEIVDSERTKLSFVEECKEELSVLLFFIVLLAWCALLADVWFSPAGHLLDGLNGAGL